MHTSKDEPAVRKIALKLREAGCNPWLGSERIRRGRSYEEDIENGLRTTRGCAVFYGQRSLSPWDVRELEVAMRRAETEEGYSLLLVLLPGVPDDLRHSHRGAHPIIDSLLDRPSVALRAGIDEETSFRQLLAAMS